MSGKKLKTAEVDFYDVQQVLKRVSVRKIDDAWAIAMACKGAPVKIVTAEYDWQDPPFNTFSPSCPGDIKVTFPKSLKRVYSDVWGKPKFSLSWTGSGGPTVFVLVYHKNLRGKGGRYIRVHIPFPWESLKPVPPQPRGKRATSREVLCQTKQPKQPRRK